MSSKQPFCFNKPAYIQMINIALITAAILLLCIQQQAAADEPSFVIDYENNQFLKDGQPFRYISGSIHYFRVPRVHWQDRLDKMKAAGLNAIQTYAEWNSHEPEPEQYNFDDNLDIVNFLSLANETGLLVILRPGPFIDAERDFGGLPYWLLRDDPSIILRSSDEKFLEYVDRWWIKLFSLLEPFLYINGGPIISIQVENEYGSYYTCDQNYTTHLRDLIESLVGKEVVLFTTDGNSDGLLKCGKIPGVYATVDFGPGTDVDAAFQVQRTFEPKGPLVNSEFYTGWLDHWGEEHFYVDINAVTKTLDEILSRNASVNMYMFHGGTSFGFSAGSNIALNKLQPCPTSYDYSAPLSEAGDPTDLYKAIRNVIANYSNVPSGEIPPATTKKAYGTIYLNKIGSLHDHLDTIKYKSLKTELPVTFEELGQAYGFIVLKSLSEIHVNETTLLEVPGIRDRGYVYQDNSFAGIVSRMDGSYSVNITSLIQNIMILVENQGRICVGTELKDFKGIVSNVTLGEEVLTSWEVYAIPLNNTGVIKSTPTNCVLHSKDTTAHPNTSYVPTFFTGELILAKGEEPQDTFLNPTGWKRGVAFLNNFNLGRYWPGKGPQVTLFVPKNLLRPYPYPNELQILELEAPPPKGTLTMEFQDVANVDGPVSHKT